MLKENKNKTIDRNISTNTKFTHIHTNNIYVKMNNSEIWATFRGSGVFTCKIFSIVRELFVVGGNYIELYD